MLQATIWRFVTVSVNSSGVMNMETAGDMCVTSDRTTSPVSLLIYSCKGGYTLVTLPRIVTPYRDSVDETRDRVTYQKLVTR
jgi:hypothetical protein